MRLCLLLYSLLVCQLSWAASQMYSLLQQQMFSSFHHHHHQCIPWRPVMAKAVVHSPRNCATDTLHCTTTQLIGHVTCRCSESVAWLNESCWHCCRVMSVSAADDAILRNSMCFSALNELSSRWSKRCISAWLILCILSTDLFHHMFCFIFTHYITSARHP